MKDNITELTIKVKMKKRWVNHFCSMLKKMEYLGNIGSSKVVGLYVDGDGDFRPKFEFDAEFKVVELVETNDSVIADVVYDAG